MGNFCSPKGFQFVNWFPQWRGFYFFRLHKEKTSLAYIYDWILDFVFWEIRKWHQLKEGELSQKGENNNGV